MPVSSLLRLAGLSAALLALASAQAYGDGAKTPVHKRDLTKGDTLYVVPYAHLDTQWRWAYPQVVRDFIAKTLHDNFALIDQYPHYVFNFSGSRRYEMMKEYYPAEYQRLKGYIAAGRWFPCGSSVDEGDANVPSAESLIRHVLYGNHFFRREFGVASHEFMLPDCFGFPYALPTILSHCGIQGFSTQKLTWGSAVGIPFKVGTWEGPDGHSIVAALDPGSYGGGVDEDLSQNTSWLARIENTGKQSGAYVDYHYYGTGDTGGAPGASSVAWVEKSIAGNGPIKVISSRADEMFLSLTAPQIAKLPHYKGELLLTQHSAGSITSQAYMKRWNRKNERLADGAEKASVAAMWLGGAPYPSKRLYDAWDLVLGSQMHDMLPGTSIPKAYEFCWNDELLALNQFASVEMDAVGAISREMDTRAKGIPIVVYNPLSVARRDVVEATIPTIAGTPQVFGPDGQAVPTQVLSRDANGVHLLFEANLPATGLATFDARPGRAIATAPLKVGANTLENAALKVVINPAGDIASIYDKANRREVLKAPARLVFQYHNPSAFPAWNMDWDDAKKPPSGYVDGPAKITILEKGPVRIAIRVEREAYGSKFVQDIRLTRGGDEVEVANHIDWQTREHALKASFPFATGNPQATYDLQVGAIKRGNNDPKKYEVPQHEWLDLTKGDGSYGAAILNDGKYGSDKPDDHTVRLTLIYTPGVRSGYEDQATQDFGRHDTLVVIAPHASNWRKAGIPWKAKRVNQPLRAYTVESHPGPLGKRFSLLSTSSDQVEVQALKKAEDSSEIILRLRELHGANARGVKITMGNGIAAARVVDGQERPLGPATVKNGALIADVSAFSLKAYAIKLKPAKTPERNTTSLPLDLPYNVDVVSSDQNRADGAFADNLAIPAELFPKTLSVDDVKFRLGPTRDGAKNAVAARGQEISLPAGYRRVDLLLAADEDVTARFSMRDHYFYGPVNSWSGYVGQWDNRLWAVDPGPNFTNYGDTMNGLVPGYVKPGEVAWFCSHRHAPQGNTYYDRVYLYKLPLDIPPGAKTLHLPNDPRVKIFAITVTKGGHAEAFPAAPLYDQLDDHVASGGPIIAPEPGSMNDAVRVTVRHPLYWNGQALRYTVDGSTPTLDSPLYTEPIWLNDPTTVKAAQIDPSGKSGPVATAFVNVHDTTPPRVISASVVPALGLARVEFSERVDKASAEDPANYRIGGAKATSAILSPDRRSVALEFAGAPGGDLLVDGVRDLARGGNRANASTKLATKGAVFTSPALEPKTSRTFDAPGLPVHAGDSWTLNLFCRIDAQPEDRTIIAGFGRVVDGRSGTGRYFTKFARGLNFWVANRDVATRVPLDLGQWQMLTATYDGHTMRLYKNGKPIAEEAVALEDDVAQVHVMPVDAWERQRRFGGEVRDLTVWDVDLPPSAIERLYHQDHP